MTAVDLGLRFVGLTEVAGEFHNPQILAMLRLDNAWPQSDEVPWCSAYLSFICHLLDLPRSRSLVARSWLAVGTPVALADGVVGFDVVVLSRGSGPQPGPDNLTAPGHAGWYLGQTDGVVNLLGGNQGDAVTIRGYPVERVLGVRRL